jgi:ribonuclease HII
MLGRVARSSGQRLLSHDRRLGARFVAGADEAGRGSLAGPLVVAGVLFDYRRLRGRAARSLARLDDSKQVAPEEREWLFRAVSSCSSGVSIRVVPAPRIDREGLHRCNLAALSSVLSDLCPPAEACLVDGFALGVAAPAHVAIVDGDRKSAAIAAASIVAKVVRDRLMRRLDAVYPRYGLRSHVGYITPEHQAAVRAYGASILHRRSFRAACYRAA